MYLLLHNNSFTQIINFYLDIKRKRSIIYGIFHRNYSIRNLQCLFIKTCNPCSKRSHRDDGDFSLNKHSRPQRSQTFSFPFSGWLVLGILRRSRFTLIFILAHLSRKNRRVIGKGNPERDPFLDLYARCSPLEALRGSQVLTINGTSGV